MSRSNLLIRLGDQWSRFTYERDDVELIGVVQRGAQIGALARLPDGSYVQANGDWFQPLSRSQVGVALKRVKGPMPQARRAAAPPRQCTPVVVVRKKRRIAAQPRQGT
jgi:hypothetical protein